MKSSEFSAVLVKVSAARRSKDRLSALKLAAATDPYDRAGFYGAVSKARGYVRTPAFGGTVGAGVPQALATMAGYMLRHPVNTAVNAGREIGRTAADVGRASAAMGDSAGRAVAGILGPKPVSFDRTKARLLGEQARITADRFGASPSRVLRAANADPGFRGDLDSRAAERHYVDSRSIRPRPQAVAGVAAGGQPKL